jgi:hypothetical protein
MSSPCPASEHFIMSLLYSKSWSNPQRCSQKAWGRDKSSGATERETWQNLSSKSNYKTGQVCQKQPFQDWKSTKGIQQIEKCLFRRNTEPWVGTMQSVGLT